MVVKTAARTAKTDDDENDRMPPAVPPRNGTSEMRTLASVVRDIRERGVTSPVLAVSLIPTSSDGSHSKKVVNVHQHREEEDESVEESTASDKKDPEDEKGVQQSNKRVPPSQHTGVVARVVSTSGLYRQQQEKQQSRRRSEHHCRYVVEELQNPEVEQGLPTSTSVDAEQGVANENQSHQDRLTASSTGSPAVAAVPGAFPVGPPGTAGSVSASQTYGSGAGVEEGSNANIVPTSALGMDPFSAASAGHIAVTANIVPDEDDIEAQVRARLQEEREEIAAQAQERLIDTAVHANAISEKEIRYRRVKRRILLLVSLVGLAAIILGVVLSVDNGENEPETCEPCRDGSDPEPGTCRCESDALVESFIDLFLPISGDALREEGTPQRDAVYWLAVEDQMNLTASTPNMTELTQRYVLAVFFYTTRGNVWEHDAGFLSNHSVCNWTDYENFLGVACNKDGFVEALKLGDNNLIGSLPVELTVLTNLSYVSLYDNGIFGTVPQNLSRLSALEHLDLDYNFMTGSISELFNIPALKELWLDQNHFSGTLPAITQNNLELELFSCESCSLNGTMPESIGNLTRLVSLYLSYNELTGPLPSFSDNNQLVQLWLSGNGLTGTLPSTLGSLPQLFDLLLDSNLLTGEIHPSIGDMPSLFQIDLTSNFLSGSVPPITGDDISDIWLADNRLSGNLSNFFSSSSTKLSFVVFYANELTGSIPDTIGNFEFLDILDLANNTLSGQVPTSIGKLRSLSVLYIDFNRLTGGIPSELGLMVQTFDMILDGNNLGGTVPTELGNLEELFVLSFTGCGLEGSFPSSVATLPDLYYLYLEGNNFTNDFNETFCTRAVPFEILAANCLAEAVVCPCCTVCCDEVGLSCVEQ